jgi:hypothetical protein
MGEALLHVPHAIDVSVRVVALSASALALGLFAERISGGTVAVSTVGLYFAATAGAYASQPYSIYYTSDFLMIAAWFWTVWALATDRLGAAVLATFVGAWAKETLLLAPILVGFHWVRRRDNFPRVVAVALAFIVPTAALRLLFPAPITEWAWWDAARNNIPFVDASRVGWTLRYNFKVLAFYNVGWWFAPIAAWRSRSPFVRDLAATLTVYLLLAYIVVYIRELRHFLPLAILVLPLTLREVSDLTRATP